MAVKIGGLLVDLDLETASFSRDMGKARAAVQSGATRMNRALASVERKFFSMGRALKKMGKNMLSFRGIVGTVAGAAGLGFLVKRALETADEIAKTADVIGISTKALQEYRHAAQLAGVETAQLDSAFLAATKRIGELRVGTGTLVTFLDKSDKALKANIISAKTTDEALELVFDAMGKLTRQTDRAALSSALFGRTAGVKMTNLVKNGTASLKEMKEEANRLGLVMDEKMLRSSEAAIDSLTRMGSIIKVNLTRALVSMAPTVIRLGKAFADAAPQILKFFTSFLPAQFLSVEQLEVRIKALRQEVAKLAEEAQAPGATEFGLVENARKTGLLQAKIKELLVLLNTVKNQRIAIEFALEPPADTIISDLEKIKKSRKSLFQIREALPIFTKAELDTIVNVDAALKKNTKSIFDLKGAAQDLGFTFSSAFEAAILSGEKLSDVLRGLLQDIIQITLRRAVTEPIAAGVTSLIGSFLGSLPGLQHGGPVRAKQSVIVGESGREVFTPDRSGTITPNNQLTPSGGSTFLIDARGADNAGIQRLEALIVRLDGSIEQRAVAAVANEKGRGGTFAEAMRA